MQARINGFVVIQIRPVRQTTVFPNRALSNAESMPSMPLCLAVRGTARRFSMTRATIGMYFLSTFISPSDDSFLLYGLRHAWSYAKEISLFMVPFTYLRGDGRRRVFPRHLVEPGSQLFHIPPASEGRPMASVSQQKRRRLQLPGHP